VSLMRRRLIECCGECDRIKESDPSFQKGSGARGWGIFGKKVQSTNSKTIFRNRARFFNKKERLFSAASGQYIEIKLD
jgi:hypothetical protein